MRFNQTYVFTHGECADHGIVGIVLAVKDFDLNEQIKLFCDADDRGFGFCARDFIEKLIESGFVVVPGDVSIVHLGNYNERPSVKS